MNKRNSINSFYCLKFKKTFSLWLVIGFLMSSLVSSSQTLPRNYKFGATFLSDTEYANLPKVNWDTLRARYNSQTIRMKSASSGITMLNNPPVGDQGSEGSCVGWAVGYTATGILAYPKYNSWTFAERSPNYIYNQIKATSDCASGSLVTDALNLIKNQGVCSWYLMPYIDGDCTTLPNATQTFDASKNNVTSWQTLNVTDVNGIKQALNLGLPVVIAFRVYQSFIDLWNTGGGIWNTANSGNYLGNHATCIVGFDDTKQMFKVQNQWGIYGGDQGFFWVTYDLVRNSCLKEVYVVSGINSAYPQTISGPSQICSQGTYTINLPGASVAWIASPSSIVSCPTIGNPIDVTKVLDGKITLSATINNSFTITKDIWVGVPNAPTNIRFFPNSPCLNQEVIALATASNQSLSGVHYQWSGGSHNYVDYSPDGSETHFTTLPTSAYSTNVSVVGVNDCGCSSDYTKLLTVKNCGGGGGGLPPAAEVIISPNPSSDLVEVSITDDASAVNTPLLMTSKISDNTSYSVSVVDSYGKKVYSKTKKGKKFTVSVSSLINGIYTVVVSDGVNSYQNKLVVKH